MEHHAPTSSDTSPGYSHTQGQHSHRPWQWRLAFWLFIAIGAYYLITEHRAHLALGLPYLPLLLFAACPLIHLFGHGGHGGHQAGAPRPSPNVPAGQSGVQVTTEHRHGDMP